MKTENILIYGVIKSCRERGTMLTLGVSLEGMVTEPHTLA